MTVDNVMQWILGLILVSSSLGVLLAKKPVHASLSFLLTLIMLATFYLRLSAEFVAVMQVLVYAGAILVIFMFVIVLFQDAHSQIAHYKAKSMPLLLYTSIALCLLALILLIRPLLQVNSHHNSLPEGFGQVQTLGQALYLDYFFPFEAVILLFLVAVIGALYIGKKEG